MKHGEIPTLHGLRAVSIGLVLVAHASELPGWPLPRVAAGLGEFGVEIFFVISGYLITTLLLAELERTREISLPRFYLRRTLRIVPAYVVFLAAMALIGQPPAETRWWPALTYTSNVFPTFWWNTGHTWSLSVEEQFYLSWPFALAFLGRRRAVWIALAALIACPVVRVGIYFATKSSYLASIWNHDFIAAGCLLALLAPLLRERPIWLAVLRWAWLAGLVAGALNVVAFMDGRWIFAARVTMIETVIALLIALFLAWSIANAERPFGRLLESRALRAIGILSYSLYLWQEPFLSPTPLVSPAWAFPAVVLAALASYVLVERPALTQKARFERRLVVRVMRVKS